MKHSINTGFLRNAFLLFLLTFTAAITWAQESSSTAVSTTATKTSETTVWYTEPWVWVVGGAVLVLLIVALTRGNSSTATGRTDKVIVTKTTTSDTV